VKTYSYAGSIETPGGQTPQCPSKNAGENPKKTTQHDFLGVKPWKFFETLVAAIHRAEMQGAEVGHPVATG
jgi:hypothetical protein